MLPSVCSTVATQTVASLPKPGARKAECKWQGQSRLVVLNMLRILLVVILVKNHNGKILILLQNIRTYKAARYN